MRLQELPVTFFVLKINEGVNKMASIKKDKNGNSDFFALCSYIEKEILDYEPNQKIQKKGVLKLRGLSSGQNVANNHCQTYGEYPYDVILMTFQLYKTQIKNGLKNKNIDSEENKISYACAIVRDKLNDVYSRYIAAKKAQEKIETINTDVMEYQGAEYKPTIDKNKSKKEDKYKDLW